MRAALTLLAVAILSFLALTFIATWSHWRSLDPLEVFTAYRLRFGLQHLLWPAYGLSRLGVTHTWWAVIILVAGVGLSIYRLRHHRILAASCAIVVYSLLSWMYVWVLPVPLPLVPFHWPGGAATIDADYRFGFRSAYREGIVDAPIHRDGVPPESFTRGVAHGMAAGSGEREWVAPGLVSSYFRAYVQEHRDTAGGD